MLIVKRLVYAVIVWMVSFLPVLLYAQDSVYNEILKDIEVTGKIQSPQITTVIPSQTLSGKRLEQLNSYSVADAVRYFSGAQIKDYGGMGGLKTIDVRGMGSQHTTVLYDGIALANAQNGTVDLGKFTLDNVQQISLYHGQNDYLLQPAYAATFSHILSLQTRLPNFENNKKYYLQSTFKTGSFGLLNPSVLWQQQIDSTLSFSINAEWIKAHGRYQFQYSANDFDTSGSRQNAGIDAVRAEAALFKIKDSTTEAFTKIYYYQSQRGLPGAVVSNRFYHPQQLWDKNFFTHTQYKKLLGKKYTLLAHFKYSNDYTKYRDPEIVTSSGILTNTYIQQEIYTSVAQKLSIKKWWTTGLSTDYIFTTLNADIDNFLFPERNNFSASHSHYFRLQKLQINASLNFLHVKDKINSSIQQEDITRLLPFVGISFKPFYNAQFALRASYKESLRIPTFNDLYYTLYNSRYLEPEYAKQYNAGFSWIKKNNIPVDSITVASNIYYNEVTNKIIGFPSASLFRWTMMNLGKVSIRGAELNISADKKIAAESFINFNVNYTYEKALNTTKGSDTYLQQIPYLPRHSSTVYGALNHKKWHMHYSFIYTGERYFSPENIQENYLQPWYTTNISIGRELKWNNVEQKIEIAINNLFNQYFEVVKSYPMPGRNFKFIIQFKL